MKRSAVLIVLIFAGCSGTHQEGGTVRTFSDSEWQAEVLSAPEPVLVDFGATWCGPCHQMEPVLDRLDKDFKVRRVDVDANKDLARRYEVGPIPSLLIFKNGKVVERFEGVTSENTLRDALRRHQGS